MEPLQGSDFLTPTYLEEIILLLALASYNLTLKGVKPITRLLIVNFCLLGGHWRNCQKSRPRSQELPINHEEPWITTHNSPTTRGGTANPLER